jgi:hypothetical protein
MKLSATQLLTFVIGAIAYVSALTFTDRHLKNARSVGPRLHGLFRYAAAALSVGVFFYLLQTRVPRHDRVVEICKAAIAIAAAGCVLYEQHRHAQQRPLAERLKKVVGIALALSAIFAYFNGFKFGYPKYYHRWDQYHYYMGAKYFPELGYKYLYRCAVVAQDELEVVKVRFDKAKGARSAPMRRIDMRAEVRDSDKKVRDLPSEYADKFGGRNLLVPVQDIISHPEKCKDLFSKERWGEYKNDVKFFRIASGKGYWTDMQKDHGFNPPPVWTIAGKFFSDLSPSNVQFMQFLAAIDLLYIIGMFIALWWGFGWRVFAVGAIFWGCQASAPFYWTGGAFLRQDWLFFGVLSVACIRKRSLKIAGGALVYSGLLRVFPGLVLIGTLVPFITHIVRKKFIHRDHKQMLLGGCIAAAVLLPLSLAMTQTDAYQAFYKHTIKTHDKTPLTNHMGLRVIVGHKFFDLRAPSKRSPEQQATWKASLSKPARLFLGWTAPVRLPIAMAKGKSSGQMQYVRDNNLVDPFKVWKDMRNERYHRYRYIAYGIVAASLAFFIFVVYRFKSLWIAQCLGQIFIILLSQLTCYYYSFMILAAPLSKVRKVVELGLFAVAAITQLVWMNSYWNDNKYTVLTIVSLVWCYVLIGLMARKEALGPFAFFAQADPDDDDVEGEDRAEDEQDADELASGDATAAV